jgi:hypothetical protein
MSDGSQDPGGGPSRRDFLRQAAAGGVALAGGVTTAARPHSRPSPWSTGERGGFLDRIRKKLDWFPPLPAL